MPYEIILCFFHFNYNVSLQRESWRKRWYDEVGSVPENGDSKDESEQRWMLKKEVQVEILSIKCIKVFSKPLLIFLSSSIRTLIIPHISTTILCFCNGR